MPGTHARGLHSFDPGSSSGTSATLVLNNVNAEDDGEEDRAGPPVDTTMANVPAAFTSTISSVFSPALARDTVSFRSTDESNVMPPPFSSSISPTSHFDHVSQPPRRYASGVHSALSSSQTTSSDARTTSSNRKRKHDATGDMPPSSSKRASRKRTETLNPVIISSQLNSTLTRLADVMEKSLVVTANSIEVPTTHAAPLPSSSSSSVIPSQLQVSGPPSTLSFISDLEVLEKAFGIVATDKEFYLRTNYLEHQSSSLPLQMEQSALRAILLLSATTQQCNIAFLSINSIRRVIIPGKAKIKLPGMMMIFR